MQPLYDINCARPQDLHLLPAIELAAAALLIHYLVAKYGLADEPRADARG